MEIKFSDLISKIPSKLFEEVGAEYKVDRPNNKLTGQALFQILLYNICEEDRISLRVIEESFQRHQCSLYHKGKKIKASKSGLSDRLKVIDYKYYEAIFKKLRENLVKELPVTAYKNIKLFDSTLITLSSKLLKCGFKTSTGSKNQIKFSVGFDGLPNSVRIGADSSDNAENVALKAAIKGASLSKEDIVVFDRGINARKTFQEFKESGISFVTRLSDKSNYRIMKSNALEEFTQKDWELLEDSMVQLRSQHVHWVKEEFRLIKTRNKITGKELIFLTNLVDLSAMEVCDIYKMRWDIEVFFKFIKPYLNTKHFLSRDINGIKVVFYMILIAALLILTFKQLNGIESFKLAKKRFVEQLRRAITYDIILLYQHNPSEFKSSFIF